MENKQQKENYSRNIRSLNKPSRQHTNKKHSPLCKTIKMRQSITIKAVEHSLKKSKSSGRNIVDSPYLQHTFRSRLVKLLKPKKDYCIHNKIDMSTAQQTEDGGISVELQFKNIKIRCKIRASDTTSFTDLLRKEIIKACNERGGQFTREAIKIIGFETVKHNKEIDYVLSLPGELQIHELQLRPIIYNRSKSISLKDFKIIKTLGSGGFSHVYLVRAKFDGCFYALKLMEKSFILENERDLIVENERFIMEMTDNPFLVKLFHAFQTKKYFAFVVEYCSGGELFYRLKKVKRMNQDDAKFYFLQILLGIKYLHQKNIIYRDLKPENLLIGSDGHMKIADFGLAKPNIKNKQLSYSFCGSPEYMAPQMLCKTGHSFTLDYYCLGALLYELVTGLPPYYSKDHDLIYESILNQQLKIPEHLGLSTQIQLFLKSLLHKNPKMRLGGYGGIKQILIHPWLGKINLKQIQQKKMKPPFVPNPYSFNFQQNSKQQSESLKILLEQQQKQQAFETYFSDEFRYEYRLSESQAGIIENLKTFDRKNSEKQKLLDFGKGITWKGDSKWTHRSPSRLRNITNQAYSSRVRF